MRRLIESFKWFRRHPIRTIAAALVVLGSAAWFFYGKPAQSSGTNPVFTARRGPLEITILEGGSLQAQESQEIKCEVRVGYQGTKILKIVEEGYLVSDTDVTNGKVLVELDSSELQKQIVQQEIQYQSALASLIDAQQNYEIQLGQNQSDIQAAQQKVRFARMDFDKFLGDTVTDTVIAQLGLDRLLLEAATNHLEAALRTEPTIEKTKAPNAPKSPKADGVAGPKPSADGAAKPQLAVLATNTAVIASKPPGPGGPVAPQASGARRLDESQISAINSQLLVASKPSGSGATAEPAAESTTNTPAITFDFSRFAKIETLGDGEAKQKLRKFEDDLQVAKKELEQATTTLGGTRRLFEKGFVTRTDLQRDEIAHENSRLKVQTAETAQDLFTKYDFLKSAEESLSKYADSVREFDKARRVAISKLAQAKARLKSSEGQYDVQTRQRNELKEQSEKCTIRATKPGLVVYGGARDDMFFYGGEERIREGASVRERQAIITIPDLTKMVVNVKIHESYIKKIKKGQKARITVDAFADKTLVGEVTKVGVLPDSQNRWMNPDMKVYLTTVTVDGTHDWLKPGMSAKVEVLVNKLEDCIYIPVQAVSPDGAKQVCYLADGLKREVETGEFNDEFIEVRSGLKEGERVLLRSPEIIPTETKPEENKKEAPVAPAAPTAPAAVAAKK